MTYHRREGLANGDLIAGTRIRKHLEQLTVARIDANLTAWTFLFIVVPAFSPACEAFRQPPDHQRCNQMIFGCVCMVAQLVKRRKCAADVRCDLRTSRGVTLCRNTFGMWSAFTKTARQGTRASLSLELLGADLEGHGASILGI